MTNIMGEEIGHMGEESRLLTSLPSITLPTLDLTTIIVVLAIQIAFFVGKLETMGCKEIA